MQMPEPRIETLPPKTLVGMKIEMSFAENRTPELWRGFMPRRNEVPNAIGTELYSVQLYGAGFFERFSPTAQFEKWAARPVTAVGNLPEGMQVLELPGGLYAGFTYRGMPSAYGPIFQALATKWMPQNGFMLDGRPHFEVLGEKYSRDSEDSEEEVWLPVVSL